MAQCAYCKSETFTYDRGVPVCIQCAEGREAEAKSPTTDQEIRLILVNRIVEATTRMSAANETFNAVMSQIPSGLAHPDGTQRIHNASHELDAAREEMMNAHTRLNEFIKQGMVPEDLKRSSTAALRDSLLRSSQVAVLIEPACSHRPAKLVLAFACAGANPAATVTIGLERTSQSRLSKQAQIYSRPVSTFAPFLQALSQVRALPGR